MDAELAVTEQAATNGGCRLILRLLLPSYCLLVGKYRFVNAVLAPHLMVGLDLTAGDLDSLCRAYVLVAPVQTALGLTMDCHRPHLVCAP
jgi:hypothetical protein